MLSFRLEVERKKPENDGKQRQVQPLRGYDNRVKRFRRELQCVALNQVPDRGARSSSLRTPEACWNISQAGAVFAYAWNVLEAKNRTSKGCRGFLAPHPGCGSC